MKSGFIIANQYAEFLAFYRPGILGWTIEPGRAFLFKTRSKCHKVMKAINDTKYTLWEMTLLETKTQYRVGCSASVNPPWFPEGPSIKDFHPVVIHAFEEAKKLTESPTCQGRPKEGIGFAPSRVDG